MSFEEVLSKAQNYLINVAKYSLEQAKQLTIACNDNEFKDIDDIIEDFKGEFDECSLIEDSAFTSIFPHIKDRQKLFIDIQYALNIKEPQSSINIEEKKQEIPYKRSKYKYDEIINIDMDTLNENDLSSIRKLYTKQAKQLLTKNDDKTFYQILAIGRQLDIPLMQNLADTYSRMKINGHVKNFDDFKQKYKLLKELKFSRTKHAMGMAPASFHARGLPESQFNPLIKIHDNLHHFYQYGKSCIVFIQNLVSSSEMEVSPLTPFQVDFWLIPKQSGADMVASDGDVDNSSSGDDTDTETDTDDENDINNLDPDISHINVLDILKNEDLLYKSRDILQSEMDSGLRADRLMRDEYKSFIQDLKQKVNDENAPQFGRFNMILDRRKRNEINDKNMNMNENDEKKQELLDEFYIYKLPDDKFEFHGDGGHVPEVYIANTKKWTLPKKGYNKANDIDKRLLTYSASDQLNGSNFILSFHVEAIDNIKCYMYYNGTCVRFFPEDMVNLWPSMFKQSKENDKFVKKKEFYLKGLDQIKIRDDKFEQWYKMTTGLDDLHKGPIKM